MSNLSILFIVFEGKNISTYISKHIYYLDAVYLAKDEKNLILNSDIVLSNTNSIYDTGESSTHKNYIDMENLEFLLTHNKYTYVKLGSLRCH